MRIGFISDIHSNSSALQSILSDMEGRDVDTLFCVGDVVGYNGLPNETVRILIDEQIESVRGNHDEALLTETPSEFSINAKRSIDWTRRELTANNREYLENQKYEIRTCVGGLDIYITHGSPTNNLNQYIHEESANERRLDRWFDDPPDLVVLGHTHQPFSKTIDETTILNPGSVGQPRDEDPRAAYAVFDTDSQEVEHYRVEYDIDEIVDETKKVLPVKLAERLYHGK